MVTGGEGGTGMMGAGTGISPQDYYLEFDAFFNSVGGVAGSESGRQSQDMYGQGSWNPLYGTMDVP